MKKAFTVLFLLFSLSIRFLAGCSKDNPVSSPSQDTPAEKQHSAKLLTSPSDSSNSADYLVIAPGPFVEAALEYADYHMAEPGDSVDTAAVVRMEDVQALNPGLAPAAALRSFLAAIGSGWRQAPEFVLLLGGIPIPDTLVTLRGDNWYADPDHDLVWEYALGRIPAKTGAEALNVLEKTKAFQTSYSGDILFVSDDSLQWSQRDPIEPEKWTRQILETAESLALSIDTFFLSQYPHSMVESGEAGDTLIRKLNQGNRFVELVGHSSNTRFTEHNLFHVSDVPELTALNLYSFIGCNINNVHYDTCFGAALLTQYPGGAAAVIAPMNLEQMVPSSAFNRELIRRTHAPGPKTLGTAFLGAVAAYDLHSNCLALFGDPAMKLPAD